MPIIDSIVAYQEIGVWFVGKDGFLKINLRIYDSELSTGASTFQTLLATILCPSTVG